MHSYTRTFCKKRKSKILTYSDFALASCAQFFVLLQMLYIGFYQTVTKKKLFNQKIVFLKTFIGIIQYYFYIIVETKVEASK